VTRTSAFSVIAGSGLGKSVTPNIDGFVGVKRTGANGQQYVEPKDRAGARPLPVPVYGDAVELRSARAGLGWSER